MRPRAPKTPATQPPSGVTPGPTPPPEVDLDVDAPPALTEGMALDKSPLRLEYAAPEPTKYEWPTGSKIAILMPTNRGFHPGILKAFAAIYDRDKMQLLHPGTDMALLRARNILANDFLASGAEYALPWDDDVIPPHGDVGYHREISDNPNFPEAYIKLHPIGRLLQAKKTLVSAVYFSRRRGGRAQFESAFANRAADEVEHRGPRNAVTKDGWCGLGFCLIHRSVFLDIQRTQPELEIKDSVRARQLGYKWRFFNPLSVTGDDSENSEDAAFCARAARAGHHCYIDHAVSCVHVGPKGFSFQNTARAAVPIL